MNDQRLASYGPLVLRISLGIVFLVHAHAKAFVFTFPGTEQFFIANGFPGWMAYPVFAGELVGGLALIAGFKTRWVAIALLPILLGALKPHVGNGFMFTNAGGGWEFIALMIAAVVTQGLVGSGAYALDSLKTRVAAQAAA